MTKPGDYTSSDVPRAMPQITPCLLVVSLLARNTPDALNFHISQQ